MSDISVERMYIVDNDNSKVKARGTFSYRGVFDIRFALIEGRDGMFVALPSRVYEKDGENKRAYDVWCNDEKVLNEITDLVKEAYKEKTSGSGNSQQSNDGAVPF